VDLGFIDSSEIGEIYKYKEQEQVDKRHRYGYKIKDFAQKVFVLSVFLYLFAVIIYELFRIF